MNKETMDQIKKSLNKDEITSRRITRALRALEIGCYPVAVQACDLALRDCEWIEQRMAIMAIKDVAITADKDVVNAFLNKAYEI